MKNEYLKKWKSFYTYLSSNSNSKTKFNYKVSLEISNNNISKIVLIRLFIVLYICNLDGKSNFKFKLNSMNNFSFRKCNSINELLFLHNMVEEIDFLQELEFHNLILFPKFEPHQLYESNFEFKYLKKYFIELFEDTYMKLLTPEFLGYIYELISSSEVKHKFGIFYTPSYLTNYICFKSLLYYFNQPDCTTYENFISVLNENKHNSKEKLKNIKVLDPSCGSGIFLSTFFMILLKLRLKLENFSDEVRLSNLKEEILFNNLFGIDINNESISITRLIFYLMLNQSHTKNNYSNIAINIIPGNSIQNDNELTIKKFNIIVGNPPWGIEINKKTGFVQQNNELFKGQVDSSVIFFIHHLKNYLNKNGIISLLIPNEFCLGSSYRKIRNLLLTYTLLELINLGFNIFKDVTRPSLIISIKKSEPPKINSMLILNKLPENIITGSSMDIETLTRYIGLKGFKKNQKVFKTDQESKFSIWMTQRDYKLFKRYFNHLNLTLGDYLTNGRGIDTNKTGSHIVCPKCTYLNPPFGVGNASKISKKPCINKKCMSLLYKGNKYKIETIFSDKDYQDIIPRKDSLVPGLIGSDLSRFRFKRNFRACYYFGDKVNQEEFKRYSSVVWKNPNIYSGEKILIRKVSTGLLPMMNYHDGFLLFNQQIYCFQQKFSTKISLKYFFALIGSSLFYYYQLIRNNDPEKKILSHFKQKEILEFPVIPPDTNSEVYYKVISLVDDFLTLTNQISSLLTKEIIEKAKQIFNQFDNMIFMIFGINDKEEIRYINDTIKKFGFKIL